MNNNLLILGAGQYGTVVKEIASEMKCFDRIAFLDDTFGQNEAEGNYHEQSIGKLIEYENYVDDFSYAIAAFGNPELRQKWTEKLAEAAYRIPVIVSPRAYISPSAQIRYGTVIEPLAGVHANSVIGIGSYISMGAVVNHNAFVGDYCHINCNAVVLGGAFVTNGAQIDAGSVVYKAPMAFSLTSNGIHAKKMPVTPTEPRNNFDDVM